MCISFTMIECLGFCISVLDRIVKNPHSRAIVTNKEDILCLTRSLIGKPI